MQFRFYKDSDSGLAHCYSQHGITEREAIEVLQRPGRRLRRKDGAMVAEGQTEAGRYLQVIYREYDREGYVFVITAYDLRGNAKRAYRRKRKRK
ncbi:MAG: hypothetical protein WBD40_14435 [Tepidisphaeraceae bacterium]